MNYYSKKNIRSLDHWINFISIFGVFFLFSNCVLYIFSKMPIHMVLGFVGIGLMMIRLIKWYDD